LSFDLILTVVYIFTVTDVTNYGIQRNKGKYHTPCLKKKQNYFCYNYVKLPPNPTIFGIKMANCLELYEVHSALIPPHLCRCTTVLIADVPNCHITL